jgi:hypothetical protein
MMATPQNSTCPLTMLRPPWLTVLDLNSSSGGASDRSRLLVPAWRLHASSRARLPAVAPGRPTVVGFVIAVVAHVAVIEVELVVPGVGGVPGLPGARPYRDHRTARPVWRRHRRCGVDAALQHELRSSQIRRGREEVVVQVAVEHHLHRAGSARVAKHVVDLDRSRLHRRIMPVDWRITHRRLLWEGRRWRLHTDRMAVGAECDVYAQGRRGSSPLRPVACCAQCFSVRYGH